MKHPSKAAASVVIIISSLLISPTSGFSPPSSSSSSSSSSTATSPRHRREYATVQTSSPGRTGWRRHRPHPDPCNGRRRRPPLRMSTGGGGTESDVDKLRAAAARAREEYELLVGRRTGTGAGGTTTTTFAAGGGRTSTVDELRAMASTVDFASGDASAQISRLDSLVESGDFASWKSAVSRRGTQFSSSSMSLLVPFPVSLETLERRTDGAITGPSLGIGGDGDVRFEDFRDLTIAVVLGSTLLGVLSLALLPPNVGATLTYLLALVPIGFIGIGSVAPGIIASAIVASRGGNKEDDIARRERMCRHEAGHFLCGYMCGLPVRKYEIDSDTGVACVEFHPAGGGVADGGALSETDIAHLSVVAMSGSVAEIMKYGKATGGEADLIELQNCFRRSRDFIGAARQQDLTRWGALTSYGIIKSNIGKYEALVRAFEERRSLTDCVGIIEATA
ncbi:hypothetical protein ACHAXA_009397 [Cyclostephanos tholiformis]|uniref:Uncharacterized protein n=1 Tax=Cyclostephanos tholiformis TaxID=382380 RepID=A0ABD3R9S3_9STRA